MTLNEFLAVGTGKQTIPSFQSFTEKVAVQVFDMEVNESRIINTHGLANTKIRPFLNRVCAINKARYRTKTNLETGELMVLRVF
jgi:hypothetical protein